MKKDWTIMAKKQRKIGALSSYKPPADAPEWTMMLSGGNNKVHGYLMYTVLYTICAKYIKIMSGIYSEIITIIIMLFFSQQNSTLKVNLINT